MTKKIKYGVDPKCTIEELVLMLMAKKHLHNEMYLKGNDMTDLINVQFCENLLTSLSLVGDELLIFNTADKEFRERKKRETVAEALNKLIASFELETGKEIFARIEGEYTDDRSKFKYSVRLKDQEHKKLDNKIFYYFDSILDLIDTMDIENTGDFIVDNFYLATEI